MIEQALAKAEPPIHLTPATHDRGAGARLVRALRGRGAGRRHRQADRPRRTSRASARCSRSSTRERPTASSPAFAGTRTARARTSARCCWACSTTTGHLHHVGITSSFSWERRESSSPRSSSRCARTPRRVIRGASGPSGPAYGQADASGTRMPGATSRWNRGKDLSWEPLRLERVAEVAYRPPAGRPLPTRHHFLSAGDSTSSPRTAATTSSRRRALRARARSSVRTGEISAPNRSFRQVHSGCPNRRPSSRDLTGPSPGGSEEALGGATWISSSHRRHHRRRCRHHPTEPPMVPPPAQPQWTPPPQQPTGWGGPGYGGPPPRPTGVTLAAIYLIVMGVLIGLVGGCAAVGGAAIRPGRQRDHQQWSVRRSWQLRRRPRDLHPDPRHRQHRRRRRRPGRQGLGTLARHRHQRDLRHPARPWGPGLVHVSERHDEWHLVPGGWHPVCPHRIRSDLGRVVLRRSPLTRQNRSIETPAAVMVGRRFIFGTWGDG